MPSLSRRSGFAVALYVLLAVIVLWLGASLVGNISDAGAPFDPRSRFSSEAELQQYFRARPAEIPEFNRDMETYRQQMMTRGVSPLANLGPHARLISVLADVWALFGALYLALLAVRKSRTAGSLLIGGGFALSFVLGRMLIGWVMPYLGVVLAVLPEPGNIIAAIVGPPVLLWLGGLLAIVLVAVAVSAVFTVVVGVPVLIFNQLMQFEHAAHMFRYKRSGLVGRLVRLSYWLAGETPPNPPDDSKGARFSTPDEVAKLNNPKGMVFGHIGGAPLRLHTDKHVLIQASTRSGKGVSLIIPHLLRYQGSAFVLDPKGENAKATGRHRATINDRVHYLDPFGITGKPPSRFNPLSRFTPSNMEAESKALAAALFIVADGERDHWNAAGQQLLAALILYVYASPDIPAEKKDLPSVRRLLLGGVDVTLKAMAASTLADGLLADLATSFLKTPEREFGSVVSTAQRQTEILDNPYIVACLSASGKGEEVDFAEWHRGTMTVYLCLSAPKFPVFNRWLRLVLTSALDEMTDRLNPPPLPVCFMLDELATLGHLGAVENAIGLAAGYGVQLVTVFQDTAQMRDLYKGRWASFIGNAGVRALFSLDDYDTAHYWSQFVGAHLVESTSQQQNVYGLSTGQNVGEDMRPLLSPEEIMLRFGSGEMLVLPQGQHPVVSNRVSYVDDKELAGLWDDPRVPVPESAAPGDARAS